MLYACFLVPPPNRAQACALILMSDADASRARQLALSGIQTEVWWALQVGLGALLSGGRWEEGGGP